MGEEEGRGLIRKCSSNILDDDDESKHLVAVRDLLRTTLTKSTALQTLLINNNKTTYNFPHLTTLLLLPADQQLKQQHLNWAIRPTAAVLKALHSVHHLQASLISSSSSSSLPTYIATVKSLEEALVFLTNSCTLAIQWLTGTLDFLQVGEVGAKERYLEKVNKCLCTIRKLQATEERLRLPGGTLDIALTHLEDDFKKKLLLLDTQATTSSSSSPQKLLLLQPIIQRLTSNGRLDKCVSAFVQLRTRSSSETLKSVGLDYVDDTDADADCITKWKRDLFFAVTEILEKEYLLCREVFEGGGSDTWRRCFAEIAVGSGFCKMLRFGIRVTEDVKKSPMKLLNMLDVFSVMDELRPTFGRLFGGDSNDGCKEIQDATRDLVKKVVEGCWEIFWELSYQVELQRETTAPPSDGGVPRLVSFVTDFCNQLLSDAYRAPMIQVMMIYQSWKRDKYQEGLFTNQMYNIMNQISLNLDSWSKAYQDRALSYLFMMNNHTHLSNLGGTKLGVMMGESWIKAHHQYRDNCAILYVNESWANISLSQKHNFSDHTYFNEVFQNMYQKHLQWSIPDEKMRARVIKTVIESVVPAYKSCLTKQHGGGGDSWQDRVRRSTNGSKLSSSINIISVQAMEDMIGSLFQGPIGKDYLMTTDKIVSVVVDDSRYTSTLTAA